MDSGTSHARVRETIAETVVSIIAEVTRYPRGILRPEADLEEELGIESVKRAEILAVLAQRLSLKLPPDAPQMRPKTIADVIASIEQFAAQRPASPAPVAAVVPVPVAPVPVAPVPQPTSLQPPAPNLHDTVLATIAEVTRYPLSILTLEADLEEELGIESVKRAEIVAVLTQRLSLKITPEQPLPKMRTIGDVVKAVEAIAAPSPAPVAVAVPVPVPVPAAVLPVAVPAQTTAPRAAPRASFRIQKSAPAARPFAGKVALVTGSGHGLGRAIAEHLARLGASIVVNSFHARSEGDAFVRELERQGVPALHAWGSVANPAHVEEMFGAIESGFGGLDFLVSAAANAPRGPIASFAPDDWERAFKTEVVALHRAAFRCAPVMERRGGGKIITVTHPGAQRCFEGFALAGPIKAAVESLTRYLAVELGPKRIQVNAVSAGPLAEDVAAYPDRDRLEPAWEARTPGGKLATRDDVARAIGFLLGDETRMVNGTTLVVDGGLSLAL